MSNDQAPTRKTYDKVYDKNAKPELPPPERPKVISIDGGRAIAARDVEAAFRDAVEEVISDCQSPAGFILLVSDDEGFISGVAHMGDRLPYSPDMFSEVLRKQVDSFLISAASEK